MDLPLPRAQLAGCLWLPRFLAKARLHLAGKLEPAYARAFCAPTGVDGNFLRFFQLEQADVLAGISASADDTAFVTWFRRQPGVSAEKIAAWNEIAVNLGRSGYPMEEHFQRALRTAYAHLTAKKPETVFAVLELDEGI